RMDGAVGVRFLGSGAAAVGAAAATVAAPGVVGGAGPDGGGEPGGAGESSGGLEESASVGPSGGGGEHHGCTPSVWCCGRAARPREQGGPDLLSGERLPPRPRDQTYDVR